MEANTSNETNGGKRQQFTNKQRMDMYAFCVLELEMHSNKVSIKKQQQAIQKVLSEQKKDGDLRNSQQYPPTQASPTYSLQKDQDGDQNLSNQQGQQQGQQLQPHSQDQNQNQLLQQHQQHQTQEQHNQVQQEQDDTNCNQNLVEGKTLLQLQQEVAMTRKCYSDYQKTQVLTSSMLRDVQRRFAKYYPDSAIPSRTTIKHVFEKCVAHGTVENIKTPRKTTKLPQGDEIEYLLIHEPQLSLRQLAQKLNVSTGTVSRRCKALKLMPESVTLKHQQLATARRQKQIKQLETQSRSSTDDTSTPVANGNHNDDIL